MRIRTIKPEFFKHDDLFYAEKDSKLPLRLAFIGLWCAADREGRFKWRPRQLKVEILPYDEVDFSRVLDALLTRGFVVKYEADGELYGSIPSFNRHQVINNREQPSKIPEQPELTGLNDAFPTRAPRVSDALPESLRGREGKGREQEGKGREGTKVARNGEAIVVLHWLNEKSGRSFRETDENLGFISARLAEPGVDLDGVKKMVVRQCARWLGTEQAEYLRPQTLFNATKFDGYYAARDQAVPGKNGKPEFHQLQEIIEIPLI